MLNDKLKLVVKCDYQEIAEVSDPALVLKVLGLIAEHTATNPETPEQALIRELRQKAEDAETRADDARYNLDKTLADLAKTVADLKAAQTV